MAAVRAVERSEIQAVRRRQYAVILWRSEAIKEVISNNLRARLRKWAKQRM